jgi:hypothetical protein
MHGAFPLDCAHREARDLDPPPRLTLDRKDYEAREDLATRQCAAFRCRSIPPPKRAQVTLLRRVAQRLLMTSAPFLRAMRTIAPSWQPRAVTIDPALVAEACPKS